MSIAYRDDAGAWTVQGFDPADVERLPRCGVLVRWDGRRYVTDLGAPLPERLDAPPGHQAAEVARHCEPAPDRAHGGVQAPVQGRLAL